VSRIILVAITLFSVLSFMLQTAGYAEYTSKSDNKPHELSAQTVYFMPHGDFASIADNGTGGLVKTDITDLFAENFRLWIESGYVRSGSSVNEVNYFYMIPVMASFDYSMRLSRRVTLSPVLSVGYTYVNLSYRKNGSSIYETKSAWEPATSAGIDLDFSISRNSSITLGSRYGAVFEKEKNMYFSMFTAGFKCRFNIYHK